MFAAVLCANTLGLRVSSGLQLVLAAVLVGVVAVGFGRSGRAVTAALAVALTMGTMNVYVGGAARLAAALSADGALPAWLGGDAHRSVPRRPLAVLAPAGGALLAALALGFG